MIVNNKLIQDHFFWNSKTACFPIRSLFHCFPRQCLNETKKLKLFFTETLCRSFYLFQVNAQFTQSVFGASIAKSCLKIKKRIIGNCFPSENNFSILTLRVRPNMFINIKVKKSSESMLVQTENCSTHISVKNGSSRFFSVKKL